jgi:hypothetical protein
MDFQIEALDPAPFAPLFLLNQGELAARRAVRLVAAARPGYPCRVSLEDADEGETLILVHHHHHRAQTPFAASHAIYVRQHVRRAAPGPGEIPAMLRIRPVSLRAFDGAGMMVDAELAEGDAVAGGVASLLAQPGVAQVHVHAAKPGCYLARALPVTPR